MRFSICFSLLVACGDVAPAVDASADVTTDDSSFDATFHDVLTDGATDSDASAVDGAGTCGDLLGAYPCNTLAEGTLVNVGCVANPPVAQGGVIADGVYALTKVDWDTSVDGGGTCPSGLTRRGTIEVCGNVLMWLDYDENSAIWRGNTHISTSNTTVSFAEFCSGTTSFSFSYTAVGTGLVMFWQYPQGERLIMTFARQ